MLELDLGEAGRGRVVNDESKSLIALESASHVVLKVRWKKLLHASHQNSYLGDVQGGLESHHRDFKVVFQTPSHQTRVPPPQSKADPFVRLTSTNPSSSKAREKRERD